MFQSRPRGSGPALPAWCLSFTLAMTCFALAGCAEVKPWERGHLAKPQMAMEPYPEQAALRAHTYGGREAATGGQSTSGGGCGCY
ncbi:DUF4266 domain-containing protein [Methyloterricola oryzae]|uniref:DUF4266 domain-containing protein n=1 Tax=Methyloterricola oryzae TaxID=1495050 RepID=UPI0009E569E8|nr:DUF4266 domain-containing protein [Methyloterricola oryzae]